MLNFYLISFILSSFFLIFLIMFQSENGSEIISSLNNNSEKKSLSMNINSDVVVIITGFTAILFFIFSLILSNVSSL
ncbi:preprotein translocase subunit SecG [Buchnera aphidicola (Mindarus keteleerifoliae)]|uniref:preprotein translocase subunit SecG n=1 Tax=Buchnera aphidicola TaxID=9 RepID=UPI0031B6A117